MRIRGIDWKIRRSRNHLKSFLATCGQQQLNANCFSFSLSNTKEKRNTSLEFQKLLRARHTQHRHLGFEIQHNVARGMSCFTACYTRINLVVE